MTQPDSEQREPSDREPDPTPEERELARRLLDYHRRQRSEAAS